MLGTAVFDFSVIRVRKYNIQYSISAPFIEKLLPKVSSKNPMFSIFPLNNLGKHIVDISCLLIINQNLK